MVLREIFLRNPVWNHPVFQHQAYLPFAQKVAACLQQEEEGPSQLSILYQAVPAIADCVKATAARNDQRACELQASFNRMAESQRAQSLQLQLLTSDNLTCRLEVPSAASVHPHPPAHLLAPVSVAESNRYASAQASVAASPLPAPLQLQTQPQPQQGPESELAQS